MKKTLTDRALAIFNAILGEGEVFAVHNGENVRLKTVALTDGKLAGIIAGNSGGVKTIDITDDRVLRVTTEIIIDPDDESAIDQE